MAALLGLALTHIFTVAPTGIAAAEVPSPAAAQVPSITPMPSFAPELRVPVVAIDPVIPADELVARPPANEREAPTAARATATAAPSAASSRLVALAPLTMDVWNADERYFSVSGSTPDEIVASAVANVPPDPSGAARSTMAYVGPVTWNHRPSYVQDPATGSCTMTAVASTVAYQATLPQWTSPSSVQPELVAWWHLVLDHVRAHESEHVRIYEGFVGALPDRVVGQPCAEWDAIIGGWIADLTVAQSAFDAAESHWSLPVYTPGG